MACSSKPQLTFQADLNYPARQKEKRRAGQRHGPRFPTLRKPKDADQQKARAIENEDEAAQRRQPVAKNGSERHRDGHGAIKCRAMVWRNPSRKLLVEVATAPGDEDRKRTHRMTAQDGKRTWAQAMRRGNRCLATPENADRLRGWSRGVV